MTDIERLAGVGPKLAEILREEGYETAEEVLEEDEAVLRSIEGIGNNLIEKMEIREERRLKSLRVPRERREQLKEAVRGTRYTLTDALRVLLPDDVEGNRLEMPEDEYVSMYVETDVHRTTVDLAGENTSVPDVLDKYVGEISSEEILALLNYEHRHKDD